MKRRGDVRSMTEAFGIIIVIILIGWFLYTTVFEQVTYRSVTYSEAGNAEELSYLYQILSAPCLTDTNFKGQPIKFVFDKSKLNDITCVNFGEQEYHIVILDIYGKTIWEYGNTEIETRLKQVVNVKDENNNVDLALVKFGLEIHEKE